MTSTPAYGVVLLAAENYCAPRREGMRVGKTVEVVVAGLCVRHGHALLHADRDFAPMRRQLGLRRVG